MGGGKKTLDAVVCGTAWHELQGRARYGHGHGHGKGMAHKYSLSFPVVVVVREGDVNGKVCIGPKCPHTTGAYSGLQLLTRSISTSSRMGCYSEAGYPSSIKFTGSHFLQHLEKKTMRVKCFVQEHCFGITESANDFVYF